MDGDSSLLPYVTSDVNNQIEWREKRVNLLHLEFYSFCLALQIIPDQRDQSVDLTKLCEMSGN